MYRGRFQLGDEVPLSVLTVDGNRTPQVPAAAPTVELWSPAGAKVKTKSVPPKDRYVLNGLFAIRVFLDGNFSAGVWKAVYKYTVGSYVGMVEDTFEIAAGGSADGQAISMYWFQLPQAGFLVRQLDSGKIKKGRNPGVSP